MANESSIGSQMYQVYPAQCVRGLRCVCVCLCDHYHCLSLLVGLTVLLVVSITTLIQLSKHVYIYTYSLVAGLIGINFFS